MGMPFFLVDAFTDRPFGGNPAGVMLLDAPADPVWMQSVAMEVNQAETAFVVRRTDGDWDLRWFTPTVEVDLCGHATLAAAHALWTSGRADGPIRFHTRSGPLVCTRDGNRIDMDFPAEPAQAIDDAHKVSFGLGVTPTFIGRNRMDLLVVLGSAAEVRQLVPDMATIRQVRRRGVIVTAPGDAEGLDFVSRFFAPQSGVDEDPVTGSAHCCLGPYWRDRLGKDDLVGFQASKRGGTVRVGCRGDRVVLGGHAVTVVRGEWQASGAA